MTAPRTENARCGLRRIVGGLECLESRILLAINIVGHWTADDLNAELNSGDAIPAWIDSVVNIEATAEGQPRLIKGTFNGHSVVRFDPTDGVDDTLRIPSAISPLGGADDFTIAVVFASSSEALRGDSSTDWFLTTGIVDASLAGLFNDWGLAINGEGQVVAGLGRPKISQPSTQKGWNDGGAHVAVYTRHGGTITLYVDGQMDSRTDGGTAARDARLITFGGLSTGAGFFEGDIAEVRLYNSELTTTEVLDLTEELQKHYFNFAPDAADDIYSVDEDQLLSVDAANGVLTNDSDQEQDPIVAVLVTGTENGTVDLADDGGFTYQPHPNFAGIDSFTYVVRDSRNSRLAMVTIQVTQQDDPPVPVADAYLAVAAQEFVSGHGNGVLANDINLDGIELTAILAQDVEHGQLSLASDGSFRYLPDTGFAGYDSFSYQVTSGLFTADEVQVDLQVNRYPVVISEVMASNRETLVDADGESSDWIELLNYGHEPVDLDGWYLTDNANDLTGWRLPSVSLLPGHFLTVFASGKDRIGPDGELHADFRLSAEGEYLGLVADDGQTIVSEFANSYPLQFHDVSFGIPINSSATVLIDEDSDAQVLIPQDGSLGLAWTTASFEADASWSQGKSGVGFDTGGRLPDRGEYASTILADAPVGYWRLEESSGMVAKNLGTLGPVADGTYLNGVTQAADGVLLGTGDRAAVFSSTAAQKIDVPNVAALNSESFSFEAWARVDGGSGYRSPLTSRGDSPQEGFLFYATPANTWQMWTGTGQQVGWTVLPGPPIRIGEWAHLVGTYDHTSKTQRFYVDGVRVASVTNIDVAPNNADPLRIGGGATEGTGAYFFEGAVDEVAVYDYLLPSTAIAAHYGTAGLDQAGIGIAEFADIIKHDVRDTMMGVNASAYVRIPMEVSDPEAFDTLELRARYDDGFVAYLNGRRVASRNAPEIPGFDAQATGFRPDALAVVPEAIDLSEHLDALMRGENTLAVHVLNEVATDGDFLFSAELVATSIEAKRFAPDYTAVATPGSTNHASHLGLGPIVSEVAHSPVAPEMGQPLYVTGRVRQRGPGTTAVILNYRLMYGDVFSTRMVDDGSIGNDIAGDGVYTGVITPDALNSVQLASGRDVTDLAGQMLRYFISTRDLVGGSFRAPYLPDPTATTGMPEYFGTVIQKEIATPLPVLQWFVPDPQWHISGNSNNKNWSPASVFFDGEFYDNIQVRVRGNTTVSWKKPKFKFEFNDGYNFRYAADEARVDEFNLQSHFIEKGAVSYMGANLAFGFLQDIGVPSPNTFHLHVRQNGDFYSLASFIEQIDATFLDRNGLDPSGPMYKAFSPSARSTLEPNPTASHYRKVIERDEPWDDFITFINGISGLIPGVDRSDYIFDHVNLPEVINDMAGNIVLINHDRLTKNYYMYLDDNGNGEWSRFPWDMDQAFARRTDDIFSSVLYGDSEHPQSPDPIHQNHLYDAILDTPFTREMYLQRIRTLLDEYLGGASGLYFESRIDAFADLIADDAALDNARWGAGTLSAGVDRLKSNLEFRRFQLEADPLVPDAPAMVNLRFGDIDVNPSSGNQDEEYIEIQNLSTSAVDVSGWRLDGGVRLTFQPGTVIPSQESLYVSPNVVAFRGRATGPSGGQGLFVQGDYEGHFSNHGESVRLIASNATVIDTITTDDAASDVQRYLRITEVHYNPAGGDDTEFIEFSNVSDSISLDLGGVTLSEGPSSAYVFAPTTTLGPGAFILIVKNHAAFVAAYPALDTVLIDGEFAGSLSNGGERIKLEDASGSTIVDFVYDDRDLWPIASDGAGASLELIGEVPHDEVDKHYHWRASRERGGSPGYIGGGPVGLVINEVVTNTADNRMDAIELLNDSTDSLDLSNWHLSDSREDLLKFPIPAGTRLGPGEYVVFDESHFNPTPNTPLPHHFALSSRGDEVFLVKADDAGNVEWLGDAVSFRATDPDRSLGRTPNGTGRLFPQARRTIGCHNRSHLAAPLVISELHYHPIAPTQAAIAVEPTVTTSDLEFVEVRNNGLAPLDLSQWRIRGGVDHDFSDEATLAAGEVLVIVSFDPQSASNRDRLNAFRVQYGLAESTWIVGGFSSQLSDEGEAIRLERIAKDDSGVDGASYVLMDEVVFDDVSPWPTSADGLGNSLQRNASVFYGNAASSWSALPPTPGVESFAVNVDGDLTGDRVVNGSDIDVLFAAIRDASSVGYFDVDNNMTVDGLDVAFLIQNILGTLPGDANLDGVVDGSDFNRWHDHLFTTCNATWGTGDINGDGAVDVSDFNRWNDNRFVAVAAAQNRDARPPRQPAVAKQHPLAVIDRDGDANTAMNDSRTNQAIRVDAVMIELGIEANDSAWRHIRNHRGFRPSRFVPRGTGRGSGESPHAQPDNKLLAEQADDLKLGGPK